MERDRGGLGLKGKEIWRIKKTTGIVGKKATGWGGSLHTHMQSEPYGGPVPPDDMSTSSRILPGTSVPGILRFGTVAVLCVTAEILGEGHKRQPLSRSRRAGPGAGAELSWKSHGSCTEQIPPKPPLLQSGSCQSLWWLSLILVRTLTALIPNCCCFFPGISGIPNAKSFPASKDLNPNIIFLCSFFHFLIWLMVQLALA